MTEGLSTEQLYARFVNTSFVKGIEPVVVERAFGATVCGAGGVEYTDLFAGISVVNAGHCNPKVIAAARAQMERLIHAASYVYYVPSVGLLAEKLANITPGALQKSFFCSSGAEAIEGAMRLAKTYTGKHEFIALQSSFHGRTNATLSITGNYARKTRGGPYVPGVAFAPSPNPYRCRFCNGACTLACADAVEDVIKYSTAGDVAAFIAEPVMGEGGIIVPHPEYFQRVKAILDRHNILFIADEVQSGFGRTGRMFAIDHFNVDPDIMVMAKGIADGFPLAAFIAPPQIADSFRPGEHLSTFGGNPVCCAAGLANIEVLEEDCLPQRSSELGAWVMQRLREMSLRHAIIGDVRGRGLMIGVELVLDRENKLPAPAQAVEVRRVCRERGVLVGAGGQEGNVVRIQPPLVISREQLQPALQILDEALASVGAVV